ncbi:MAG: hypothetical protein PUP91_39545 [Rhizonema sp. PD37]|nr:hypothetical protein [Rhizonema sp. PD37]
MPCPRQPLRRIACHFTYFALLQAVQGTQYLQRDTGDLESIRLLRASILREERSPKANVKKDLGSG